VSLGFWEHDPVIPVTQEDINNGYSYGYLGYRGTFELEAGILTGGIGAFAKAGKATSWAQKIAKGAFWYDVAGNTVTAGRGAYDVAKTGELNWQNGSQIAFGSLGLGGNYAGYAHKVAATRAATRARVMGNIAESRAARQASNFGDHIALEKMHNRTMNRAEWKTFSRQSRAAGRGLPEVAGKGSFRLYEVMEVIQGAPVGMRSLDQPNLGKTYDHISKSQLQNKVRDFFGSGKIRVANHDSIGYVVMTNNRKFRLDYNTGVENHNGISIPNHAHFESFRYIPEQRKKMWADAPGSHYYFYR